MHVSVSSLDELVSQADREGVTLAEVIARSMTPGQMNTLQKGLTAELEDNYAKISSFMEHVETSSMVEIEGMSIEELMGLRNEIMQCASDAAGAAEA
jgi:ribosomal protein S12